MTILMLALVPAPGAAEGAAPEKGWFAAVAAGLEPGVLGLGGAAFWARLRGAGRAPASTPVPQSASLPPSPPASAA